MSKDTEDAEKFCQTLRDAVRAAVNDAKEDLLTEVRAAKSPAALASALRSLSRIDARTAPRVVKIRTHHVRPMEEIANYIYAEMLTNYRSSVATFIAGGNAAATYGAVLNGIVSAAVWAYKVKPKADWDHKPMIVEEWGLYSYDRETSRLYRWDIWSNIHYGFVGAAIGYSPDVLTFGASATNIISSNGKSLFEYGQGR